MKNQMKKIKSNIKVWDNGKLVPAWNRKPKNELAEKYPKLFAGEEKINWYIPANKLYPIS